MRKTVLKVYRNIFKIKSTKWRYPVYYFSDHANLTFSIVTSLGDLLSTRKLKNLVLDHKELVAAGQFPGFLVYVQHCWHKYKAAKRQGRDSFSLGNIQLVMQNPTSFTKGIQRYVNSDWH